MRNSINKKYFNRNRDRVIYSISILFLLSNRYYNNEDNNKDDYYLRLLIL